MNHYNTKECFSNTKHPVTYFYLDKRPYYKAMFLLFLNIYGIAISSTTNQYSYFSYFNSDRYIKKKIYEMFKHDNQYGYQYKYNTSKNSSRFDFKIAKFRINCHSRCLVGHHARLVFTRFRFLLSSLLS